MTPSPQTKMGISDSEWREDPEGLIDWVAWLQSLDPVGSTPEETVDQDEFDDEFRKFNIEAVRKQMEESDSE
ncbi:MAG TPA: hypothetical protein VGP68_16895 [Gemmataceae bacterium]|jgi:hypothetical protein|nr:hypothetical protein [Gemmataceae bacterium]